MVLKILAGVVLVLAIFLGVVALRPSHFKYERSGVINAPADKIYPYLSDFELGTKWSPFEQVDPNEKRAFGGEKQKPGSFEEWEGNSQAGSGRITITDVQPDKQVDLRLEMRKPMAATNHVVYALAPAQGGTLFTWTMEGESPYLGKLAGLFIDCDKLVGGEFEKGIANLKAVVEKP